MASVIRVSVLGTLPGGEVWSVNPCFFCLDEPASISGPEALAIATAVDAIVVPTGLRTLLNSTSAFTATRVEARDREGLLEALGEHSRPTPVVGSGTSNHPYQTSVVTSLRTAFPGGQGRGRLYWPGTGVTISGTTLRIDSTALSSALSGVKTYLTAIQAAVAVSAGPVNLAVWSRTGTAFHAVTSLRMGDVADTQRRRRDTLNEGYSELAYP
jgi:hypothetical protein